MKDILAINYGHIKPDARHLRLSRGKGLLKTTTYRWMNAGGKTAETDSPTPPPGGGWTQLKQAPAQ
jgi:hypothetical protein